MTEADGFIAERNAAFSDPDEDMLRDWAAKWNVDVPEDMTQFWTWFHRSRSGLSLIDSQLRERSICWLKKRGLPHWGDE